MTINDAIYYESSTTTTSDTHGDLTGNPETVTHFNNEYLEQTLLSNRTIPVLPPPTNSIISVIKLTSQTLLTSAAKENIADAKSGGAWMYKTPRRVTRTEVGGCILGGIGNSISIIETPLPDLIGIVGTTPPCGLNLIQEVGDICKSTSPGLVRQYQKMDATVDRNWSDYCNSMSIFR